MKKPGIVISTFFSALILFSAGCLPALEKHLDDVAEKELAETISKSPELQSLEKDCEAIPRLRNTWLVRRNISTHGPRELYYYFFADGGLKNTRDLFNSYFRDEWEMVSSHPDGQTFKRGDFLAVIQYGGMGSEITYAITCKRVRSSRS